MQRTRIEWVRNPDGSQGYSWNPIKGVCRGGCSYCYARKIYHRFKLDPTIRFDENELIAPRCKDKPSGIFVCSTHDIFGFWVNGEWIRRIFNIIYSCPQHRFYILTKYPENVPYEKMPDNVWFGITITGEDEIKDQHSILKLKHIEATVKFISFEPLLGPITDNVLDAIYMEKIDWVITGAQTQPLKFPLKKWIKEIEDVCDCSDIPFFKKYNLLAPPETFFTIRQEFPHEK